MTNTIIPKTYSNVIYLQPSFSFTEDSVSSLRQLPYVKVGLEFPWEEVLFPIEQAYLNARFEDNLKRRHQSDSDDTLDLFSSLPQDLNALPVRSSKGRRGINFYSLFKSFILAPLLYVEVMVSSVHLQVIGNSDFRMVCGFDTLPSLKTFERFDRIMIENGLWEKARQLMVNHNILSGVVEIEEQLAVDTTHVEAEATIHKSKKCGLHSEPCDCPKVPTDDNVGVMRKSNAVSYIAHKLSYVCGVESELPLSRSVFKGGDHDATTLEPTLKKVTEDLQEEFLQTVEYVSADGIYQTKDNQQHTKSILQAKLLAPINPRKTKDKVLDSCGITKLDRYGIPHCISDHKLQLKGSDETKQQYIWTCPVFDPKYKQEGLSCTNECHIQCCNGAKTGRTFRVDQSMAPQIDTEFPQHLQSFKKKYRERTSIERVIGIAKDGYSMRRVHKRGHAAVEAHVDRCMMTAHALAYMSVKETGQLYRGWTKLSA